MTLTTKQFLHVQRLNERITALQDEVSRFLTYVLDEAGLDPTKQYLLVGKELVEKQSTPPVTIQ